MIVTIMKIIIVMLLFVSSFRDLYPAAGEMLFQLVDLFCVSLSAQEYVLLPLNLSLHYCAVSWCYNFRYVSMSKDLLSIARAVALNEEWRQWIQVLL
jgi:hypothetical protein